MDNGNRVGSANGGFHRYRRSTRPTPAQSLSPATELRMGLPANLNRATAANAQNSECTIREQDRFIPTANVIKIMRRILPPHAKISDDSKVTIQECVSEFISFITGEANDHCKRDQRKTITAEDLLRAMSNFGFDEYIEPLTFYLQRYREYDAGVCGSLRGKPLLCTRPMVHLPPTFQMSHHQYGYFVYPPPTGHGYMQGDASYGCTSQCAIADVDCEVESPAKEGKE